MRASERAPSLGANGALISAKGVAGPSVPGARAGEWAAKAAKAKRAMEEEERESAKAAATAAAAPSSSSALLVPSPVTNDPEDVPEVVSWGDSSSSVGR